MGGVDDMLKDKKKETKRPETEKKNLFYGLTIKIIGGVCIPLIIGLSGVGFVMIDEIVEIVEDLKSTDIASQALAASHETQNYFDPFFTSVKILADIDAVQEMFDAVERQTLIYEQSLTAKPENVPPQNQESVEEQAGIEVEETVPPEPFDIVKYEHFDLLMAELEDTYINQNGDVMTAWVSIVESSQLFQSDGYVSDSSYIVTERPWYKLLTANHGEPTLTGAYTDVASGKQIVSVVAGVFNDRKEMVGAAGMDVALDELTKTLASIEIGETGYVTVYDNDQNIIYHPDDKLILQNMKNVSYSQDFLNELLSKRDTDVLKYQRGDNEFYGATLYLKDLDWQVLACMPEEEFVREGDSVSFKLSAGFVFCAVVLAVICILLARTIVKPVKKLDEAVAQLAEGDLDVDIQINTNDETRQLAQNVNRLVDRLKTYILYINEVSDVLDDLGHGDLIFHLKQDYVGEFNRLKVSLENIQSSLSTTICQIMDSATQVDNSTVQISTASQALAQGATEQASTVQELSNTIQDLSTKSVMEAEKAIGLSKGIGVIGSELTNSNQQMRQMVEAMENITAQSNEIGKIIKTIEDIAFQTNILALNAAVEAARAGAAGKGFAVVADEVRSLANKSSEAAKSITGLIQSTVAAVNDGSQIVDSTAQSLGKVAQDVSEVVVAMEKFAERYQVQTSDLGQVANGIDQISAVVQNNSATAEESAASSEELAGQSRLLKNLTDKFQVDDKFRRY